MSGALLSYQIHEFLVLSDLRFANFDPSRTDSSLSNWNKKAHFFLFPLKAWKSQISRGQWQVDDKNGRDVAQW